MRCAVAGRGHWGSGSFGCVFFSGSLGETKFYGPRISIVFVATRSSLEMADCFSNFVLQWRGRRVPSPDARLEDIAVLIAFA